MGVNSSWHRGSEKARAEIFGSCFIFFCVALRRKEPNFARSFPQFRRSQPSPVLLSTIWIGMGRGPRSHILHLNPVTPEEAKSPSKQLQWERANSYLRVPLTHITDTLGARREVVEGSWESCQVSHFWQLCHTFLQFWIWLRHRKTCRFLLEIFLTYHLGPLWHSWAGNMGHLLTVGSQAGRRSWVVEVAAAAKQDISCCPHCLCFAPGGWNNLEHPRSFLSLLNWAGFLAALG